MIIPRIILTIAILFCGMSLIAQDAETPFSFKEIVNRAKPKVVEKEKYKSYDEADLVYYHYKTIDSAKATLVFVHGGGAHSLLGYTYLAETLQENYQIETYLIDIRGHGYSEGRRGDCPRVNSIRKDVKGFLETIKSENKPTYLAGHSSGAGFVLNYASWGKKEPVDGYFFVSPELGYKSKTEKEDRVDFAQVKLYKFVINGMTQGLLFPNSYAVFFNYPKQVLKEQPLILGKITVNMANAITPYNPKGQLKHINEPIGFYIGEKDEMFNVDKVMVFGNLTTNKNSIVKVIPNKKHLSILIDIGNNIGKAINTWEK